MDQRLSGKTMTEAVKKTHPETIFLADYREPDFDIAHTDLIFELKDEFTEVVARLDLIKRNSAAGELVLTGQDLTLVSVVVDGRSLSGDEYRLDDDQLVIPAPNDQHIIQITTQIYPEKNLSFEGLYKSRTMYCTQCEAEGFRKITYYLDRPDVLSEFTTEIIADKSEYPILLSNGNKTGEGELDGNRHWVKWHDPFKKPCYLFALVAGSLSVIRDQFTTMSGRNVAIEIFVEEKDLDKCDHAIASLKNAMRWDEQVYGREYDLDIFMIVAVDDFNMGAMENKGLNIFNTSCVLANPKTTTDGAFQRVEGVVAHEYFHNWSGNRVTCRDWFQLSLKEGFTVFRDAEFSSDMGSRAVKRIEDVNLLRTHQFAEDAGPMAHPVQPASFIEISNFYTLTVYEKGAEVVRMIYSLLGKTLFRKGSDLYFERHDGDAVTIEDFVKAMADVSGRDFTQFMNWYRQAGTPKVSVKTHYNETEKTFALEFTQSCPATPESSTKAPFVIPMKMGLIGKNGPIDLYVEHQSQSLAGEQKSVVLELTQETETVIFHNVNERPVPSLLQEFSAPVKLNYRYSREELARVMRFDEDEFNRWEASQLFSQHVIEEVMGKLVTEPAPTVDEQLLDAFESILNDENLDPAIIALMLQLPSEKYLAEQQREIDVDLIHHARNRVKRKIANKFKSEFFDRYQHLNDTGDFDVSAQSVAKRSLKNTLLDYLVLTGDEKAFALCITQIENCNNMTDELAAFSSLVHSTKPSFAEAKRNQVASFYERWKGETLVVNNWLGVLATVPSPNTLDDVTNLLDHEAYDESNPNKMRALIGGLCMRNPIAFHRADGKGYEFLANQVIMLNAKNPQMAARLLTPLTAWKKYDEKRRNLMHEQLERIASTDSLSKDVYEVVSKSL